MSCIIKMKLSKYITYSFILIFFSMGIGVNKVESLDDSDREENFALEKKRKLTENEAETLPFSKDSRPFSKDSRNAENFNLLYELAASYIPLPTPRMDNSLAKLNTFLGELGKTIAEEIIDKLIDEKGYLYFSHVPQYIVTSNNPPFVSNNGTPSLIYDFLVKRKVKLIQLTNLAEIDRAVYLGYKIFVFEPTTSIIGNVLAYIATAKGIVSKQGDKIQSFTFKIPEFAGECESGQLGSFLDLPSNFKFSSATLDFSGIEPTFFRNFVFSELLKVFANGMATHFNNLVLDGLGLTDDLASKLRGFICAEKNSRLTLSLNRNLFTSNGLKSLLNPKVMGLVRISSLSLQNNLITDAAELIEIFGTDSLPTNTSSRSQQEQARSVSTLELLDLSNNPFSVEEIKKLLKAFKNAPAATQDWGYYGRPPLVIDSTKTSRNIYSLTNIILKDVPLLKDTSQAQKAELKKLTLDVREDFKLSMDHEFYTS
jgi:hypothetical protein